MVGGSTMRDVSFFGGLIYQMWEEKVTEWHGLTTNRRRNAAGSVHPSRQS
jgi:hypothetical protein